MAGVETLGKILGIISVIVMGITSILLWVYGSKVKKGEPIENRINAGNTLLAFGVMNFFFAFVLLLIMFLGCGDCDNISQSVGGFFKIIGIIGAIMMGVTSILLWIYGSKIRNDKPIGDNDNAGNTMIAFGALNIFFALVTLLVIFTGCKTQLGFVESGTRSKSLSKGKSLGRYDVDY